MAISITSLQNERVKNVVKLRNRNQRDEQRKLVIEGYRPILRATENGVSMDEIYYCPAFFLGSNEMDLVRRVEQSGAQSVEVAETVFAKMAYRDRPEGLLAIAPQVERTLADLPADPKGLYLVAEAIEKPGNLGTILRSADAAGATALIVCDRCTDIYNPNVVRASIGTLFTVPVVEAGSQATLAWCRELGLKVLAASPHASECYTDVDMAQGVAIVVGTEQYGLSDKWMEQADMQVSIPMLGQADSLNVASSVTLLLYEAVRQRRLLTAPAHRD